jgi:hypothetical protein
VIYRVLLAYFLSVRLLFYGFRRSLLMPLVRPLHEFILFVAVPLLGFAEKPVIIPFDLFQVVNGTLAILRGS